MQKLFIDYVTTIIFMTFDFKPEIEVTELPNKTVQVVIDGSEWQRKQMMGKESHNFQAIKSFLKIFARRQGYYGFIYIKSPYEKNKLEGSLPTIAETSIL